MTDDNGKAPRPHDRGRPKIGGRVSVRLGDLLPAVDAAAARKGLRRPQYIREAVEAQLARDTETAVD